MKIIIFEPNPDMSTNPTLVSLVRRLSEDGIPMDIYQPPDHGGYLPLALGGKNTKFYNYKYFPIAAPPGIVGFLYHVKEMAKSLVRDRLRVFIRLMMERKAVVLAIDPRGVVEAYSYCRWLKVPFVYFSFEIFFMDELRLKDQIKTKQMEVEASRKAAFTVIQDVQRGKLLEEENGLSDSRMFYMPVAPSAAPAVEKTEHLRRKFDIKEEKTIVVHAGSFSTWTYAEELLGSVSKWPDDFVLVVHTRCSLDGYVQRLMRQNTAPNIIFSTEPCNDTEYLRLLASADIGLLLYKPVHVGAYTGKNLETVGLASGKFSCYMKCGIPTISIRQNEYRSLIEHYKFGLDIDGFNELHEAFINIQRNYTYYSSEAKRLFDEKLNFDLYYPGLKRKLLALYKE
jgi:glycosyltransferase involved in cell wall biosynthesis